MPTATSTHHATSGTRARSGPGSTAGTRHPSAAVPVPRWWRDLSAAIGWGLVLFVVGLWVSGGGLTTFGSWSEALTNVGRIAGLLASVLLLIQAFLIARVPFVEQAWGQDELVRVHRLVGFTGFTLMTAHVVLTVAGYSVGTGAGLVGTFVDQVLHAPGMLLALAGTVALVMVVVTSVRRARARLRYESWHLLHLYAYLGVGLALPHQLWTGADFLGRPGATCSGGGSMAPLSPRSSRSGSSSRSCARCGTVSWSPRSCPSPRR